MSASATTTPDALAINLSVAEKFRDNWVAGLSLPSAEFLTPFAPHAVWYDHFIRLHLTTLKAIEQSRMRWLGCLDDFKASTYAISPTPHGAVIQLKFSGIFARDILPAREATQKRFLTHVCFVLGIDDEGRIEKVDEYLPMDFDDGKDVDGYKVRDGGVVAKS
ncbi:MAG: hypothetical protein MMC33_009047 [Icmadophila ericetorum]|nr:hypothetical protein [Icmadophila ericetorum]